MICESIDIDADDIAHRSCAGAITRNDEAQFLIGQRCAVEVVGELDRPPGELRRDFTERDDQNWLKHTVSWLDDEGKVWLGYRPVHLNTLSNEVQSFPPKARVY